MAAAGPRRRKLIGHRRRVEEDGEDEAAGPEALDLDDDSLTEGSIGSDDDDAADDSDTSNIDEASPTAPNARKPAGNGAAKAGRHGKHADGHNTAKPAPAPAVSDTEMMLNGLSIDDKAPPPQDINFDEIQPASAKPPAPVIVSSSSAPQAPLHERRRREHEEYRRKRDEDPAFVPNRGAFFMHDHRHSGPAANGFRPFARGGGRGGRGRGGFGATFAPTHNQFQPSFTDPTTNAPWTHDMHDAVADHHPLHRGGPRAHHAHAPEGEGPPNGNGIIPYAKASAEPINRAMSTEKHLGNATIRVVLPAINANAVFPGIPLKQYTKLPDHRPPLRRDKPVRISLPYHPASKMPRYIYPPSDRSFIFIPRALRPNAQQRMRGKGPRSNMGSIGGLSRRTSVFGGSYYGGSVYSPSIALSRRSSIAPDVANGRDYLMSPTGSVISRPPLPMENPRPVVRLPPLAQPPPVIPVAIPPQGPSAMYPGSGIETSINDYPQPQTHPLPQKPIFQENRPNAIPMHQPRPQKAVSVENIEPSVQNSPNVPPQPYQGAFHQQVPPQALPNGYNQDSHTRNSSYPSQISTGTPLSQIPERAIHAAPFQPNAAFPPQNAYYGQQYPVVPQQGNYYYPQPYNANLGPNASAPAFIPAAQHGQPAGYGHQQAQGDTSGQANGQPPGSTQGLVAQEVNGMVYYFEPSQLPPMTGYQAYPTTQPYAPGVMGGMVTPSPDGFYYQQPAPGMVYYSQ
ncbi:hypothetical protein GQ53DRAFT_108640 [Thozetella sp. PMI_491]|nr:hypothetical protein GQ53DRAFT_108640 [Thozetella sp. PMI_491]